MKNAKIKLIIAIIICVIVEVIDIMFFNPKENPTMLNVMRYILIGVIPVIFVEAILLKSRLIKNKYIKFIISLHCIGLSIGAVVLAINIVVLILK